jgi:hypothetical protein
MFLPIYQGQCSFKFQTQKEEECKLKGMHIVKWPLETKREFIET